MDSMKIVYKVLSEVDKQMDDISFDESFIKDLKASDNRVNKIIETLLDEGYLTGIKISKSKTGNIVMFMSPRLTIKGMEFLQENSTIQKIKNGLKDIKDVTPFINLFDTSFKGWYNTSIQMKSVRYTIYQGQKREELPLFPLNIISFYCLGIVLHNAI